MSEYCGWAVVLVPAQGPNDTPAICVAEILRLGELGPLLSGGRIKGAVISPTVISWDYIESIHSDLTNAEVRAGLMELESVNKRFHKMNQDDKEAEKAFERLQLNRKSSRQSGLD